MLTGDDEEDKEELILEKETVFKRPKKVHVSKPLFSRKKKKEQKKKAKSEEPIPEPSIDNWFYENFGIGKLFKDDDDQPMDG